MRRRCAWSAALAGVLVAAPAAGQESPQEVARRDLITQAEQAASAGDHARAAELGQRVLGIRPTPSIQYFVAREHQALDHPVEALAYAGACARAAEADPSLRGRDAILQACREIATAMEPRIGRVTVRAPSPAPPGLTVRVGATVLAPALFSIPFPVTPGAVSVDATAEGYQAYHRELHVAAGQTEAVDITLAPVAIARAPTPVAPPRPTPTPDAPTAARRGPGPGPWIVAGVGVASLALAGVFYGLAAGARGDRDALCDGRGCDAAARSLDDQYAGYLLATNVSLAVGAAAVIGGAAWFVLGRRASASPPPHAALRVDVAPAPGGASLGLRGSF